MQGIKQLRHRISLSNKRKKIYLKEMISSCGHSVFFYTVIVRVQHGHDISL